MCSLLGPAFPPALGCENFSCKKAVQESWQIECLLSSAMQNITQQINLQSGGSLQKHALDRFAVETLQPKMLLKSFWLPMLSIAVIPAPPALPQRPSISMC